MSRGVATVLVLGGLATIAAAAGPPAARADESPELRVTVTGLGPTMLRPDGTLRVRARVVNASDATVSEVGARLRVGPLPIGSRSELATLAASSGLEPGTEVGLVPVASLVDVAPTLEPGAAAEVEIEVAVSDLGFVPGFGVHPLTLELRVGGVDGVRRTAGAARTFVVTAGPTPPPTLRAGLLWPLVGVPARGPDLQVSADAAAVLRREVGPGGRLGRLVAAGSAAPVTWLVDPALLADVRSVATGNGLAGDAPADAGAASWLDAVAAQRTRTGTQLLALPYADPDLVAVERAGLAGDLPAAAALGGDVASTVLGGPVESAPAWPAAGRANRATLRDLAARQATVLLGSGALLPQSELPATPDAVTPLTEFPGLTAVVTDDVLGEVLTGGPDRFGGPTLARQRLLAETALIAAERPSDPRTVLATPSRRWDPQPGWAEAVAELRAPWLEAVTLGTVLAEPGDAPARLTAGYPARLRAAEVSATQLAALARDRQRVSDFSAVLADPAAYRARYQPSLFGGQSTAWRADGRRAGRAYTARVSTAVADDVTSVRILQRGQVTLSSRAGSIPLAVENTFAEDVTVRVEVRSTPAVRLTSPGSVLVTVPAGRTASVDVPAVATADASFPVTARLVTQDGSALGVPVTFTVRATGYGQVARVVVGGALVLLAVAVVVRVARRIRAVSRREAGTLDP